MRLKDRVAIVAGGGQGIGEGCVKCLAEEGADVAVVDINGDTAKKIANEVKSMGRKALPIIADLTEEEQVDKAVQEAVDFFGKIDILVNSVGGRGLERSKSMERAALLAAKSLPSYMAFNSDVWDKYYRLNLKSHVMLSHAVTPHFTQQRSGRIVNISSIAGRSAVPDHMPYAAMKASDISITWSLARALAPYNVTVNCVCPGFVYTPLWAGGATSMLERARKGGNTDVEGMTPYEYWMKHVVKPATPLRREQTIEDMGRAVVFFASDDGRNVTGQVLHVDGGVTMR